IASHSTGPHIFPTRRSSDLSEQHLASRHDVCVDGVTEWLELRHAGSWDQRYGELHDWDAGCERCDIHLGGARRAERPRWDHPPRDRKSTRLNSSHVKMSYAV